MYIYIDYNTYTRIPQYSTHVFLARRGQGLLGMFVCLYVCMFVCLWVTARPWVRRTYVCATAPSIWIFFPIFFILGGGRRDVFFDHSRPDTFTSQFVLWTSEWTCRERRVGNDYPRKSFASFADSEKSVGLIYLAFSRSTEWNNLCIGKSIT